MGIGNLYHYISNSLLKNSLYKTSLIKEITLKELSGKSLAIDTNAFIYKYSYGMDESNCLIQFGWLMTDFYRYKIKPIFVFDGKAIEEKKDEKEKTMKNFRDKKYDALVSTSVVEVGVDIPNATIMLIEAANHFGLAQLHQLRGRVGRGDAQSYCLLIPDDEDAAENERLTAMTKSNDGFYLAEVDLKLRGPGDFLGTRQSGYANLRLANLSDVKMIEKARRFAQELIEKDADLKSPEHQNLAVALDRFWGTRKGDIS